MNTINLYRTTDKGLVFSHKCENNTIEKTLMEAISIGVNLDDVEIIGESFNEIVLFSPNKKNQLGNIKFINCTFKSCGFNDIDFRPMTMSFNDFRNCDFYSCDMNNLSFVSNEFKNCSLYDCDLANAKFVKSILKNTNFYKCNIDNMFCEYSTFNRVAFDDCKGIAIVPLDQVIHMVYDSKNKEILIADVSKKVDEWVEFFDKSDDFYISGVHFLSGSKKVKLLYAQFIGLKTAIEIGVYD